MGPIEYIRRWWQSRGFGVQSHTDFEYLHEVLRQPLDYYAYASIASPRARLIYRICNAAKKGRVAFVGCFSPEELQAASMAMGQTVASVDSLLHLHGVDTLLISGIDGEHAELWQQILQTTCITWDMRTLGLAQFLPNRYAEHYSILPVS